VILKISEEKLRKNLIEQFGQFQTTFKIQKVLSECKKDTVKINSLEKEIKLLRKELYGKQS